MPCRKDKAHRSDCLLAVHGFAKPLTYDHSRTTTSLTISNTGLLPYGSMLDTYLRSAEAVDKRMKTAETTALIGEKHDAGDENHAETGGDVFALDHFMCSVTNAPLVQEAWRFMGGR
jgi:hypothetical protein